MLYRRLPRVDIPGATYFIGCCIEKRRHILRNSGLAELVVDLYAEARDRGDILLHAYVVLPDHYHVVATLVTETSISRLVRKVHSLFWSRGKALLGDLVGERIWQRRFHDHVVRDDRDWLSILGYVHQNPVTAGLVEEPVLYPLSSCAFWETGEGPVRCDPI